MSTNRVFGDHEHDRVRALVLRPGEDPEIKDLCACEAVDLIGGELEEHVSEIWHSIGVLCWIRGDGFPDNQQAPNAPGNIMLPSVLRNTDDGKRDIALAPAFGTVIWLAPNLGGDGPTDMDQETADKVIELIERLPRIVAEFILPEEITEALLERDRRDDEREQRNRMN